MKTIFNVYIEMQDQAQCDRMKQLCVDNGLPIWDEKDSFKMLKAYKFNYFCFDVEDKEFYIINPYNLDEWFKDLKFTQATETEFIELLKTI